MNVQIDSVKEVSPGKFSVKFQALDVDTNKISYVVFEVESAPVFSTSGEAFSGGNRALLALDHTGRFPNMCVPF